MCAWNFDLKNWTKARVSISCSLNLIWACRRNFNGLLSAEMHMVMLWSCVVSEKEFVHFGKMAGQGEQRIIWPSCCIMLHGFSWEPIVRIIANLIVLFCFSDFWFWYAEIVDMAISTFWDFRTCTILRMPPLPRISNFVADWYQSGTRLGPDWYQTDTRLVLDWYQTGTRLVPD